MLGRTLAHFRIDAKLGEGGMGVVYRATDEKLRREVALKVLPESLAADPERRSRFLREARAAAAVTHNNIATVHEIGEADGHVFIAMELVSGETLRERMAPGLSHPEAIRIAKEIARGLSRAHEKGIVHRDLKPENVMITPDGDVKILDFGLAKVLDVGPASASADTQDIEASHATVAGRVMGTPAYMSPEQAEGRSDIDARSDVFSFGVMLYEMLAGVAPFTGTTSVAIMYAVLHREPEPLEALCPGAPAAAAALVARCLRKPREERFASGRELVAALEGEQATQSPEAPSGRALPAPMASTVSGMGTALGATLAADVEPAKTAPRPVTAAGRGHIVVLRTGLLMVALVGVLLGGRFAWRSHAPVAPAPSASSSAAPRITTITDRGLPESAAPEARTEYAAGLQLLRDDNYATAQGRFAKAAELESSMALPHLRLAVLGAYMGTGGQEKVRAELAKAAQMRAQLDERDGVLLDAVEPLVGRTVPDDALAVTRLMAARERFPLDEEFVGLLAELTLDDPVKGAAFARAATELDPHDAAAWERLGRSLGIAGDLSGARVALERCAAVSTESADCYHWLAMLDGAAGRCADMERDATRQADSYGGGNLNLACALVALGRPEGMVREALARAAAAYSPDVRAVPEGVQDAWLATTLGRFDVALARLDEVNRSIASNADLRRALSTHAISVGLRVQVLREMGNEAGVRAAAREFTDRVELLARGAHGNWGDLGHYWWIARAADVPLDPGRREWVELQNESGAQPAKTWMFAWAQPVMTPEEATLALNADSGVALPRGGEELQGAFGGEAATGRVYLLAGKPADAIPYLKRAANNCLALMDPINHFHAELDLGRALEQTHENDGACDEYRKVVAQWGHATPRSVSADAARSGMKRLACPP